MAQVKRVKDVYGDPPAPRFGTELLRSAAPKNIWANYDAETDSMLIFITGEPQPGMNVYLGDGLYIIVSPENEAIGFYVETWEKYFVPAHKEFRETWQDVKQSIRPDSGWSELLRMAAFFLVALLAHADINTSQSFQPA